MVHQQVGVHSLHRLDGPRVGPEDLRCRSRVCSSWPWPQARQLRLVPRPAPCSRPGGGPPPTTPTPRPGWPSRTAPTSASRRPTAVSSRPPWPEPTTTATRSCSCTAGPTTAASGRPPPGCSSSAATESSSTTSDLAAVLEYLDARDAVVAGHSMGGMAAQAFAIAHPEVLADRVAAVALVSTACSDLGVPGPGGRLAPRVLGSSRVNSFVAHPRIGPFLVRGTMGRTATLTNLRAMQDTFAATEPSARAAFYRAMEAMDLTEGLADVDVPVLVVSGTRDQLVAHSNSRRLADIIDGARFEAVRGAGHMLPLETPDVLADVLEGLVATSEGPPRTLSAASR
ncbi:MAG: alpha/beta hydrolase [Actinobacteria bacterium]|nr:MAG: alpha/beta hydrolase [Actinomycetota bacterium]